MKIQCKTDNFRRISFLYHFCINDLIMTEQGDKFIKKNNKLSVFNLDWDYRRSLLGTGPLRMKLPPSIRKYSYLFFCIIQIPIIMNIWSLTNIKQQCAMKKSTVVGHRKGSEIEFVEWLGWWVVCSASSFEHHVWVCCVDDACQRIVNMTK